LATGDLERWTGDRLQLYKKDFIKQQEKDNVNKRRTEHSSLGKKELNEYSKVIRKFQQC
jgi:hypothetical protein